MTSIFRGICGALDRGIYTLVTIVYRFLMDIANIQVFDNETINEFSTRIYTILGIFMGFKLIFTFINYAVNPDSLTDSKTGGKKLVINIIVSIVLLIAVPTVIFPLSRELQNIILKQKILEKVVLGIDGDVYSEASNDVKSARMTSYFVFSSFFYPSVCDSNEFYEDDSVSNADWENQDNSQNYRWKLNGDCAEQIVNQTKGDKGLEAVLAYEKAYNQFSVNWLTGSVDGIDLKDLKTKENGEYLFEYILLVPTIVGLAVAWILFTFCFDIAVRAIKLGFLELIAPIPILSYIDSKTKQSFDNWVKACMSAYIQLFVKLMGVYFAIFVISNVGLSKIRFANDPNASVSGFVKLFIIIGALIFAGQLPKLIDEIFKTNLSSAKFSLNPLKNSPLANAVVGGAIGGVAGTAGGLVAGIAAGAEAGAVGRGAIFGAATGLRTGAKNKYLGGFNKGMNESYKNLMGKDFVRTSLGKELMKIGADKKIDKISEPLKVAREQKRKQETKLGNLSSMSADVATRLSNKGINPYELNGVKKSYADAIRRRDSAAQFVSQARAAMNDTEKRDFASYKRINELKKQRELTDVEKNHLTYLNNTYGSKFEKIDQYDKDNEYIDSMKDNMDLIDRYQKLIAEEDNIRSEIGKIDKDISTLSDEKKDRQRFYGKDESTKKKVSEALKSVEDRDIGNN